MKKDFILPETIGSINENGQIEKEYSGQGFIYKNYNNFFNKQNEICYISENDDAENIEEGSVGYSYNDLLSLCIDHLKTYKSVHGIKNAKELVEVLFETLDWSDPSTILDGWS